MNVLIISQCAKDALVETRRIIDQFAERNGDRTWLCEITEQGLITLKRLLNKTCRKNTAVACFWVKANHQTELMWIIGDKKQFNEHGKVYTNFTERNILKSNLENNWNTCYAISLLASIAGLFHDFGKSNNKFQEKLINSMKKKKSISYEPIRHEWISLRLFLSFITKSNNNYKTEYLSDKEWLEKLADISNSDEEFMLKNLIKDALYNKQNEKLKSLTSNPFKDNIPNIAKAVAWLILSHHKLPIFSKDNIANLDEIEKWFRGKYSNNVTWNSPQISKDWNEKDFSEVWTFAEGTPFKSSTWKEKAKSLAIKSIKNKELFEKDWLFEEKFSIHLSRLVLILSDHIYSSKPAEEKWQDKNYLPIANTNFQTKKAHQKLDEHNIGVAHYSYLNAKLLPKLSDHLPSLSNIKMLKKRSENIKYQWQNKAFDCAVSLKEESKTKGFFGINMASTGCGKTFANAKIMYGLSDDKKGCRFNIGLGLRTLTLQTADALKEKLNINSEDDIAVIIGSESVLKLHELRKEENKFGKNISQEESLSIEEKIGKENLYIDDDNSYISYEGSLGNSHFSDWIGRESKINKLISAPIVVSTIDYLITATEGIKGGKQIAPMLRLLSSDLILDEPDDFDLNDLPALCRLVNWAGLLGSRVLLSSATLAPDLLSALFQAYFEGRKQFDKACNVLNHKTEICCAWFDESLKPQIFKLDNDIRFREAHSNFVDKRVQNLENLPAKRLGKIVTLNSENKNAKEAFNNMCNSILENIYDLHSKHSINFSKKNKNISIGLIRMANINPLVAVAENIFIKDAKENTKIHFCVYHSKFPLIVRSKIEEILDSLLTRHDENKIWELEYVTTNVLNSKETDHIFVVLATSVAEVGRDHDYDWAIAEPSSMRSIIQLAGRVLRHRDKLPKYENIAILNKNFKAICGTDEDVCYEKPGFEDKTYKLNSKDLNIILEKNQFEKISSISRIKKRDPLDYKNNLVDLEHFRISSYLLKNEDGSNLFTASLWWERNSSWCGNLQKYSPFRKNNLNETEFFWILEDANENAAFHQFTVNGELIKVENKVFDIVNFSSILGKNLSPIINLSLENLIMNLSNKLNLSLKQTSIQFTKINLQEQDKKYNYDILLGFHENLKKFD